MIEILKTDGANFLLWLLNGLIAIFLYVIKKTFVGKDEHNELKTRVASVENTLDNLPDGDKLQAVSIQITELSGELKVIEERLEGFDRIANRMQKQVDLMDEYLRRINK